MNHKIGYILILLYSILSIGCGGNLRGKPIPPNPDLAGFYISSESAEWAKNDKMRIEVLSIFPKANGDLSFERKVIVRLSFIASDNREEWRIRTGGVVTSDTEILLQESLYQEYHQLHMGARESDPTKWKLSEMGAASKVREVGNVTASGNLLGEFAPDGKSLKFGKNVFTKIGEPFQGRITTTVNQKNVTVDNEIAGVVFYKSSATSDEKIVAVFSKTELIKVGMIFLVGKDQVPYKVSEVFQQSCVLEPVDVKKIAVFSVGSPVLLKGTIDRKAVNKRATADELIRKLKSDPNVSKEELIREIEKLKNER
ncbi:LIC12353 family lipoprotein [Leptospira yasudae]|uniref:Lipoprotein n=1 Tax=Leptospira yasudae TaxID=2202201 RepID=A0A6N4QZI1_9LEPT|nr:hypothetical protein [Leptospira yasudae]TGL79096.1 hypothetical protein EHQ72_08980 [Leptospira yasudae]TGL83156.1 hypothetical protein EHQ77_02575 [Leptospira yasudae]TGL85613.1 hypothetical protein EHQ83_07110 [Leptospira yasudae]